jgi:hypothetical protein
MTGSSSNEPAGMRILPSRLLFQGSAEPHSLQKHLAKYRAVASSNLWIWSCPEIQRMFPGGAKRTEACADPVAFRHLEQ